jgi:hypothetical protein
LPLNIEHSNSSGKTSSDWIDLHGLKAKRLNLYQVLAPNAYSYMEDYVPILNKTVQSQVHEVGLIKLLFKRTLVNRLIWNIYLTESNGSVCMARWDNEKSSRGLGYII